jgi:hypothetical protein
VNPICEMGRKGQAKTGKIGYFDASKVNYESATTPVRRTSASPHNLRSILWVQAVTGSVPAPARSIITWPPHPRRISAPRLAGSGKSLSAIG